jgi:hypothetical protein
MYQYNFLIDIELPSRQNNKLLKTHTHKVEDMSLNLNHDILTLTISIFLSVELEFINTIYVILS